MKKVDSTILKETAFVFAFIVILSVLMQAVFLIVGHWDLRVLFGNLLGASAAGFNFFLMGLSVQRALGKDPQEAKNIMRTSQSARLFLLFAVALVGYLVKPAFHLVAVVIPFLFPRIAILLRGLFPMD